MKIVISLQNFLPTVGEIPITGENARSAGLEEFLMNPRAPTRHSRQAKGVIGAIAAGSVAISFAISLGAFLQMLGMSEEELPIVRNYFTWIQSGSFEANFGFMLDHLSGLMILIVTGVAWLLALCYWLMEVRRWELPWLVTLGQTALVLYFAHQVIEETIIHRALGLRFNNWLLYWTANIALIVLCVYMGRAWQAVKPRVRALVGLATA